MIIVDARGSGASSGVSPHPWSAEELADYGEVASWAAKQPWCNGNVGAVGISYEGSTAALLASTGVDAVKGVVPQEIEFDVYTDIALPGGIPNQAFMSAWSEGNRKLDSNQLPVWFPLPWYGKWIIKGVRPIDEDRKSKTQLAKALEAHTANTDIFSTISKVVCRDDPFGDTGSSIDDWCVFTHTAAIAASGIPLFVWGSWMDANTADSVIRAFHTFDNPQIGVIGAWSHEMTTHGSPFQRPKSKPDPTQPEQWELSTRFLEKVLRSKETIIGKKIFYYTLGAETWKQAETFPPPGIQMMSWYFQPEHGLSTEAPVADDVDEYQVDFEATTGTHNRWHTGLAKPVIYSDRAKADLRLLTYTSKPLAQDLEITGYPVARIHLSSTHDDGAFIVYLEEVDERGRVRYLTEGNLRGIHRALSPEKDAPHFVPGMYRSYKRADMAPLPIKERVELTIRLMPISALVRRGRRIRVAIAGADAETFARIPAKGVPTLEIARGPSGLSQIELPVL